MQEERPEALNLPRLRSRGAGSSKLSYLPPEKKCIKSICDITNWLELSLINLPGPEKFRLMTNRNLQWNIHCPHLSQLSKFSRSFFYDAWAGSRRPLSNSGCYQSWCKRNSKSHKICTTFGFRSLKFQQTWSRFRFIMDPMEENIFLEEHMKLTFSIMNDLRKRKELSVTWY